MRWLARSVSDKGVLIIILLAAEETKSRINNLISYHFWYIQGKKQFFFGFCATYTEK